MTEDLTPLAASYRGDGMYKPVPDDTLEILERLVDAAEDVIAWYAITGGDMTRPDCRGAMARLLGIMIKTLTFLERTP